MRAHNQMLTPGCDRPLIQRERVWGRQRDGQLQQQPDGDQLHISRQQHRHGQQRRRDVQLARADGPIPSPRFSERG